MTQLLRIAALCEELIEKHGTRNPFDLAEEMGIHFRFCPEFSSLKGMYKIILEERFIFINGNLSRREAREVMAHEIGHDVLHREMARSSIVQDHFLLDMRLKPEYEANAFAAHLLYEDRAVMELLKEHRSESEIAARLKAPIPLLKIKLEILSEKGLLPSA